METETQTRHSALEELYRDERRPALLLLSGLLIAVLFFPPILAADSHL
jgi:hypothetical protein